MKTEDSAVAGIEAITEGFRAQHRYNITPEVYAHFLAAFRDTNLLHTDDEFARRRGFPERLTHGAILNGFISHFVGVHLPADAVLEQSVSIQFKSPCHIGDQISIEAIVTHISKAVKVATIELLLINLTRNRVAAKAKVQFGSSWLTEAVQPAVRNGCISHRRAGRK